MSKEQQDLAPICMRARSFAARGQIDDALDLYGDVLRIDPDFALAYADRGTVYAMTKRFEPAMQDLERAFSLGYSDPSALSTAGTICLETAQYGKALNFYERAIAMNPDYPFTYYNRASVHLAMGNRKVGMADLEQCLRMGPEDDFKEVILRRLKELEQGA